MEPPPPPPPAPYALLKCGAHTKNGVFDHFRIFQGQMEKRLFRKKVAQLYCGLFELSWSLLGQKIEVVLKIPLFLAILCFAAPLINTRGFGRKKWLVSLTTFVPVYYKLKNKLEVSPSCSKMQYYRNTPP